LIEQLHYTTTPKYNFPLPPETLHIPQKFIELSLKTLKTTKQQTLQLPQEATFNNYSTTKLEGEGGELKLFFPDHNHYTIQSIPLKPIKEETTIVAIDVSSIKIGETNEGIICAIRGTVVWKERNRYKYLRIGPFPLHITEENKTEIHRLLRQHSLSMPTEPIHYSNLINMPTKLGNLLERWIKMKISCASQNSIILWDGSLTAGTASSPIKTISQTLEMARNHLNTILAFSKNTYLRFLDHQSTISTCSFQSPYLLEINDLPTKTGPFSLLGKVYMTKLTRNGCSFRLDIDKEIPNELRIEAVEKLLGNDLLFQSYPETLRLAHIFSTFTAIEVIAMQRFLVKRCGLKILNRPNIRRLLFGPFGYGSEA